MKLSRDTPTNLFVPTKEEFYSYPRCKMSCEIENENDSVVESFVAANGSCSAQGHFRKYVASDSSRLVL